MFQTFHFILSLLLLLTTITFFWLSVKDKSWAYTIVAGISSLLLISFHPYYVPLIWGVFATSIAIYYINHHRNNLRQLGSALVIMALAYPAWPITSGF